MVIEVGEQTHKSSAKNKLLLLLMNSMVFFGHFAMCLRPTTKHVFLLSTKYFTAAATYGDNVSIITVHSIGQNKFSHFSPSTESFGLVHVRKLR